MTVEIADAAQRAEALDTGRSFIVQAPAGSGKTRRCVERCLEALAGPDQSAANQPQQGRIPAPLLRPGRPGLSDEFLSILLTEALREKGEEVLLLVPDPQAAAGER